MGNLYIRNSADTAWITVFDENGDALPNVAGNGSFYLRQHDDTWHVGVKHNDFGAYPKWVVGAPPHPGPTAQGHYSKGWQIDLLEHGLRMNSITADFYDSYNYDASTLYQLTDDLSYSDYEIYRRGLSSNRLILGWYNLGTHPYLDSEEMPTYWTRSSGQDEWWLTLDFDLLRTHRRFRSARLALTISVDYLHRFEMGPYLGLPVEADIEYSLPAPMDYQARIWLSDVVPAPSVMHVNTWEWPDGNHPYLWAEGQSALRVQHPQTNNGGSGTVIDQFGIPSNSGLVMTRTFDLGNVESESYMVFQITLDSVTPYTVAEVPGYLPANSPWRDDWVVKEESFTLGIQEAVLTLYI